MAGQIVFVDELSKSPGELLSENHGDPAAVEARDVVVLIREDEAQRRSTRRMIAPLFDGYEVLEFASCDDAYTQIRSELRGRVAMIVADIEERGNELKGLFFLANLRDPEGTGKDLASVPVVITAPAAPIMEERTHQLIERQLGATLDGLLSSPTTQKSAREVLQLAVLKRRGLIEGIESDLKEKELSSFVEYYKDLSATWLEAIKEVSFWPGEGAQAMPETPEGDLQEAAEGINRFREEVYTLASNQGEHFRLDQEALSTAFHDINGALTILISGADFAREAKDLSLSDKMLLDTIYDEAWRASRYVSSIMGAYRKGGSWAKASRGEKASQVRQKLEFPEGTTFCVIDDSDAQRRTVKRTIGDRGTVFEAHDEASLAAVLAGEDAESIQVFILDHQLEGGLCGHQLIEQIRERCPAALIIAHTSAAIALNAEPENPYQMASVEIVNKRAWGELSGVMRKSFALASEKSA